MPAQVLAVLKVFPESDQISLEELRKRLEAVLPEGVSINKVEEEPIAFGLKALKVYAVLPPNISGGTESVEEAFKKVKGVSEVEVELVHSLL